MAAHMVLPWVHRVFACKTWALGEPPTPTPAILPRRVRLPLAFRRHRRRNQAGYLQDVDRTGATVNGHFRTCYHPLFVFNQFGDLEPAFVPETCTAPTTMCWNRWSVTATGHSGVTSVAFVSPEVYEFLEAEDFSYAIRLPAN